MEAKKRVEEMEQQRKAEEKAKRRAALRRESGISAMAAHFIGELKAAKDKGK